MQEGGGRAGSQPGHGTRSFPDTARSPGVGPPSNPQPPCLSPQRRWFSLCSGVSPRIREVRSALALPSLSSGLCEAN